MIDTPSSRNARACSARYSGVAGYTNRPPTWVGPPAFGRATSGTTPAAGRMLSYHAEQLRRPFAAVRADRVGTELGEALGDLHRRGPEERSIVLGERGAHRDGDARRSLARGPERLLHLQQVRLRLDDQEIDACLRQGLGLLAVRGERILRSHPAVRRQSDPERPDGPRDEAGAGFPSERGGRAVQLARPRGEAVDVQAVPVATERVREDDVGARLDERAMDGDDPLGSLDVQQLETRADGLALFDQRRAHAAVGQERTVGQERSEGRAVHRASVGVRAAHAEASPTSGASAWRGIVHAWWMSWRWRAPSAGGKRAVPSPGSIERDGSSTTWGSRCCSRKRGWSCRRSGRRPRTERRRRARAIGVRTWTGCGDGRTSSRAAGSRGTASSSADASRSSRRRSSPTSIHGAAGPTTSRRRRSHPTRTVSRGSCCWTAGNRPPCCARRSTWRVHAARNGSARRSESSRARSS